MIALASNCLVFQLSNGESVPLSADAVSLELMGSAAEQFDRQFLYHATKAVFHYFQRELGRKTVGVDEFTAALEKALKGFKSAPPPPPPNPPRPAVLDADLVSLALDVESAGELFFFPRLREELRSGLRQEPGVLRFHGLRGCAMRLAGARRWTPRCAGWQERIVNFLRECLSAEANARAFALLIE